MLNLNRSKTEENQNRKFENKTDDVHILNADYLSFLSFDLIMDIVGTLVVIGYARRRTSTSKSVRGVGPVQAKVCNGTFVGATVP
jgi:hypothetical protein